MITSITASAGSIQSGDVMVKIENDDVTNMPLLRGTSRNNECMHFLFSYSMFRPFVLFVI